METVKVALTLRRESQKAWLCEGTDTDGKKTEVWIPKSQIQDMDGCLLPGDSGDLEIAKWIAIDKDLIEGEEED